MWITRKRLKIAAALFVLSELLFLVNVQFPRTPNFDEFHYVPSAKQFLNLQPNQNWEHPPLGKMLIATGIALFGDRPIGWRFMSTVFGAITLVGMYALGIVIFSDEAIALWIALLTICNQLLFVQSRIGMLDTFMFGFLIWAMVAFCASFSPHLNLKQVRLSLAVSGGLFGLAIACKWFAIVPWVACGGLIAFVRLLHTWEVQFVHPKQHDWFRPSLWRDIAPSDLTMIFLILPVWVYFFTFIPLFMVPGNTVFDFISMQQRMFDGQLRVVTSHPYMSHWWDWPTLKRPIWYAFDREGSLKEFVRGVLLIGNPLVMWTGLVAIVICISDAIKKRNREAFLISFFYVVFYSCWFVIPRKISFYYYYYPAGMMLSFAVAYVFYSREKKWTAPDLADTHWIRWAYLGASMGMFIYFFPILAALRIPADSFRKWMWFSSWI